VNENEKQKLRDRAKALAREPQEAERAEDARGQLQVIEFLLAYERYGIESSFIREVYPLKDLTPLPCTPPFVLGIINVRGQIRSVLDIKRFFDLPQKGLTDLNQVLLVRADDMELGILADEVLGARSLPLQDIGPAPATLTGIHAEYLRGVTAERLIVLNVAAILSDERIIVDEEVEP
jgi:purine-binding chemotaxis protein CheW